jgi:DNA-binding GntR family transcriptional regulator
MPGRRHSALLFKLAVNRGGTSQQTIVDELRRVILDGGVPPGSTIPVGDVAELFGVSAIPVRESLKTLSAEGLVQHQPNVGYTVAQLTAGELAEMYLVRETLESAALAAAVELATDGDRARVVEINRLLEVAVREDDSQTYHRLSREFHVGLTRPSRMLRLMHMLESAWNITEPVQAMVHVETADRALLHQDHQIMLDAFTNRDVDRLLAAATMHHHNLNRVVATLPPGSGLIEPDG